MCDEAATSRMMPATQVCSDAPEPEWDAFVNAHPDAMGCHSYAWRRVFERVFGLECQYLLARRAGEVTGVLPLVEFRSRLLGRFLVSLPFLNGGGLVTSDSETARALIDEACRIGRGFRAAHLELRHRSRQLTDVPARQHKVGMTLPLEGDSETAWSKLDRKVRNQVRKAEKSGLSAATGREELVEEFYSVFASNMRDLGTPVFSRRLFIEVLRQFPSGTVFVVRHNGEPIAAAMSVTHKGVFEVPWAGSLKTYRNLCPTMLLYWTAIRAAIGTGCHTFDFGRSTPDAGTYHFKMQWGAVPEPLNWEYVLLNGRGVPDQGPSNPKFRASIAVWKRLPLWVTTAIGPGVVRNFPG